jgi:histidine triad (HIT) family protein
MSETIFSKIVKHEIPAEIIYEDEQVLAFLDIRPVNKGHTVVIPKVAFENIFDADEDIFTHMTLIAKRLGSIIKATLAADGVNLVMNNGTAAGQEVWHAHIHIIPRFRGDGALPTPTHQSYEGNEASVLATQLRAAIDDA